MIIWRNKIEPLKQDTEGPILDTLSVASSSRLKQFSPNLLNKKLLLDTEYVNDQKIPELFSPKKEIL